MSDDGLRDTGNSPLTELGPEHTGFGDCACYECWPPEPDYPLADHGKPFGLLRSLWCVLLGVRLYGR